jgi:hypothetical protein
VAGGSRAAAAAGGGGGGGGPGGGAGRPGGRGARPPPPPPPADAAAREVPGTKRGDLARSEAKLRRRRLSPNKKQTKHARHDVYSPLHTIIMTTYVFPSTITIADFPNRLQL